jgi:alginate O-acetyltransferase complex protein AlgI
MTFDLLAIFIAVIAALIYSVLLPARWRGWALMIASVIAVYRLQPALPIRYLDFILPTATIVIAVACWWWTRKSENDESERAHRRAPLRGEDRLALVVIVALVVGMSLMRFVDAEFRLTASRPPEPIWVILALVVVGVGVVTLTPGPSPSERGEQNRASQGRGEAGEKRPDSEKLSSQRAGLRPAPTSGNATTQDMQKALPRQRGVLGGVIFLVVLVFVTFKTEALATELSRWLRGQAGQDTSLASMIDLNWLGFSYIAFRLIHMLRDRQSGLLPALTLRETVTYLVFFPALVAGPIDRAERFAKDFRALPEKKGLDAGRWTEGITRIAIGILNKFVIADSLAQGAALNSFNAAQAGSTLALWALLYGYALRLFFDFSGYSDIAIGIGILFNVKLPENFDRPYLKTNLAAFWQSWHMTLSSWARFYVFSPLSRALLMRKVKSAQAVFITQMTTMGVIGLWHGMTLNFLIWGAWHGLGLFIHKRWTDRTRARYMRLNDRQKRAVMVVSWFVTFHYVVIGWVWFALPDVGQSARVLARLVGIMLVL